MKNNIKKFSFNEHDKINALVYCQECKIYMCNKCDNYHSNLFKNHNINKIENDMNEIFSEYCKKDNQNFFVKHIINYAVQIVYVK